MKKILPEILPQNRDKCFYCSRIAQHTLDTDDGIYWLPVCQEHRTSITAKFPAAPFNTQTKLDILVNKAVRVMKDGLETNP